MALQKQPININFSKGLDTKTDPKQVQLGNFLALQNSVFDKAGGLVKRNGFKNITKLPDANQTTLTTLNNNLLATGSNLYAYSKDTNQWLDQGLIQPVQLETQALVRISSSQSNPDMAIADTGLACLVYLDNNQGYYQISDSSTGQQIVPRTSLPAGAISPRVFVLGRFYIITYLITAAGTQLQYIAIPTSVPTAPRAAVTINSSVKSLTAGYDCVVAMNGNMYVSWANTGNSIKTTYLSPTLILQAPVTITARTADLMALAIDQTTSALYVTFYNDTTGILYAASYSLLLAPLTGVTLISSALDLNQITTVASNDVITILCENNNLYTYSPNAKSDFISKIVINDSLATISNAVILRSVGLASKAFIQNDNVYVIATYGEVNQPTYLLIDSNGNIYMRLAYANGGGYVANQVLSNVNIINSVCYAPYLIKDFLAPVNKGTNIDPNAPVNAIYTQTGINLAKFSINTSGQYSSEIANTLHLTGGMLWQYDGVKPVENGFHVYPENVAITTATGSGNVAAGTYYYTFTYEWTDNQGNLHRSAPSIPVKIVTTTASSTNTINVPMLRLTYKTSPNPVRIVGYRWSVAQQVYYQFTSVTSPVNNDPTVDSIAITDALADSAILGQTLLYTTGGVIENIAPPASKASALFKNRLWLIDAENQNLLWFSKQVIQNVPVEMSDLLTLYVAPTSGAQGSTGVITALSAMDDKLIIFKKDAIYYVTGTGPDNTGASNDFSDPIFITSAVGCSNPNSIVLMPNGLMFQSDKGIWILGRDLSTNYIGAPVEEYNTYTVYNAKAIPATNQVRFVLNNRVTLMYDYYYGQWGTFNNLDAISSTLYNSTDTYLSNLGAIYQETDGFYLDGSTPVLLSFTTSWISLAGIQGLERFYEMYILGSYKSPFKLQVQLAYDYNPSPIQSTLVLPDNYSPSWGSDTLWGGTGPWGGPSNVFEARVFPQQQKCETFQLIIAEIYDPSYNVPAGEGLSLSGLNIVVGMKRGYRTNKAGQSFG